MTSPLACGSAGSSSSGPNTNSQNPLTEESKSFANTLNSRNTLYGTWVNGGYSLTFNSDNTYSRDLNLAGAQAVRGSFAVSGNVIMVTDSDSCINGTTGETTSGSYTFTIAGNALTFNIFHDPCSDRAAFLRLTYTKQ
jgi:hypothetical protein